MSAAVRARISASQKARWAKVKGQRKVVSIAPKHRRISPAGLARIRAATKARWLQPDEQMWIDVGRLIRERVPDQSGKTLPVDLTSGAYEFRDLTNPGNGTLFEGKVIYDKTYGHVTYGCGGPCCDDNPYVQFNPLGVPFLGNAGQGIDVPDNCGGLFIGDNAPFYGHWSTASTSIATVDYYAKHSGVGVGSTTSSTYGTLSEPYGRYMCSNQTRNASGPDNVPKLTCTSSVARGQSTTCTVSGPTGTSASGWKFTAGSTTVNRGSSTSLTWSGVMLASGTVSVIANVGAAVPLSSYITVTARNWHTSPAVAAEAVNGTFVILPVPPQPTGVDAGLGESKEVVQNNSFVSTFISDGGPNNGFGYYATKPTFTTTYQYEINPDLKNTSSTFYTKQCGNYNATTKPSGFISGSNLLTQTRRHEYNSTTQSHYAFYSNSISGANNPGDYVESRVATPGTSPTTFDNTTGTTLNDPSGGNGYYQKIYNDFSVQPFGVNSNANGTFLGNINYAPYAACT